MMISSETPNLLKDSSYIRMFPQNVIFSPRLFSSKTFSETSHQLAVSFIMKNAYTENKFAQNNSLLKEFGYI